MTRREMERIEKRMDDAVELGLRYGGIDGSHHKMWVIDQMLRLLLADIYDEKIKENNGPPDADGETEYDWDVGIAP